MSVPFKSAEYSNFVQADAPHYKVMTSKWNIQEVASCQGAAFFRKVQIVQIFHILTLCLKPKPIRSVMKGTHSAELGNTSLDRVKPVSKMAEIKHSSPSLSCFRISCSSICKFAFLCRRDSLFQNDCGNCVICSTVVTFNAPEKWGCCRGNDHLKPGCNSGV